MNPTRGTGHWLGALLLAGACLGGAPRGALAKPWAELAPAPLASDSAYAALSARPRDSLDVAQLGWMEVQRDWRAQRDQEDRPPYRGLVASGGPHRVRRDDARFAALAARPYEALTESERAWLVMENTAQRADNRRPGHVGMVVVVLIALGAGAVWGVSMTAHAFADGLGHL